MRTNYLYATCGSGIIQNGISSFAIYANPRSTVNEPSSLDNFTTHIVTIDPLGTPIVTSKLISLNNYVINPENITVTGGHVTRNSAPVFDLIYNGALFMSPVLRSIVGSDQNYYFLSATSLISFDSLGNFRWINQFTGYTSNSKSEIFQYANSAIVVSNLVRSTNSSSTIKIFANDSGAELYSKFLDTLSSPDLPTFFNDSYYFHSVGAYSKHNVTRYRPAK